MVLPYYIRFFGFHPQTKIGTLPEFNSFSPEDTEASTQSEIQQCRYKRRNPRKTGSKAQIAAYLLMILAVEERGGLYRSSFRNSLDFCQLTRNTWIFSFMTESQQSHPSQRCPPVSPMDTESA